MNQSLTELSSCSALFTGCHKACVARLAVLTAFRLHDAAQLQQSGPKGSTGRSSHVSRDGTT
jgi:hypothetical protein